MEHAVSSMSLAHTIGNVTAFYTELLKGFYPKDFFGTVVVSETIAYRYFDLFEQMNKAHIKRKNPKLIIQPRIDVTDGDVFLKGSLLTNRVTDNYADVDRGNLQPFYNNKRKGNSMKYLLNRISMSFDITMIFETQMEQINQGYFLRNRIRQDRPQFIETALESQIPISLIRILAKDNEIDMKDKKALLNLMNSHSIYPVTYKMKNSTGNDEFFRYYPVQLDTTFTNLSLGAGSRSGMITNAWPITFTINTEFFTAGLYYYFTESSEVIHEIQGDILTEGGDTVIPFFTIPNLFDVELPPGWEFQARSMFKVASDSEDHLDFSPLLDDGVISSIKYHQTNGIPVENFLRVDIVKNNIKQTQGVDYTVDFDLVQVNITKGDIDATYRIIIYVNTLYINGLLKTLHKIDEEK